MHPFLDLVTEALNLLHPRFAGKDALTALPADADADRVRPVVREFYHQFRRLWDKALPVRLGLGHLMIQPDTFSGPQPDLLVWQLGENGAPDRRFAAISFVCADHAAALDALARARAAGYAVAVRVVIGPPAAAPAADVFTLTFDPDRWQVTP